MSSITRRDEFSSGLALFASSVRVDASFGEGGDKSFEWRSK
jgi:hypothetical protein